MLFDKIISLTKQLYPTGRAFKMPKFGVLERLHNALALSEERTYEDAVGILESILPDTANFSIDDARDWEKRLGLITNEDVTLDDRKLAIQRKMNYNGGQPARQHYLFLQGQLQAAGFNVFVYENRFPDGLGGYTTKSPQEVLIGFSESSEHGEKEHGEMEHGTFFDDSLFTLHVEPGLEHGELYHGPEEHSSSISTFEYTNKVVNHLEASRDTPFLVLEGYRNTFFVGGDPLGSIADVPASREQELRQLILKLKPQTMVGYLLINYI